MTRKKARGRFYYYLYVYDRFNERGMRPVFSLGNTENALNTLEHWKEHKAPPRELISLGMDLGQLTKWRKSILENNSKENLASCTYKEYNKNRKRHAAPTEALS